jgi:hypothetical protein
MNVSIDDPKTNSGIFNFCSADNLGALNALRPSVEPVYNNNPAMGGLG